MYTADLFIPSVSRSTSQYPRCHYDQSGVVASYTQLGTVYTIYHTFVASPIYVFGAKPGASDPEVTTSATISTSLSISPGSSATLSAATGKDPQTTEATSPEGRSKSSLSTGAIAGIAVSVGVIAVIVVAYFIYRSRKKRRDTLVTAFMAGTEPGVGENPGGIGGIQDTSDQKS
ncbi:hypothetical protein TWF694_008179 [Orbilia ellipsospora]|uniref:Mid2 domain-containing protein n=1 Tax=Orbilia ellipsospora TaxID=2528407 RepID=A0AAV9XFA9_9PEZI